MIWKVALGVVLGLMLFVGIGLTILAFTGYAFMHGTSQMIDQSIKKQQAENAENERKAALMQRQNYLDKIRRETEAELQRHPRRNTKCVDGTLYEASSQKVLGSCIAN